MHNLMFNSLVPGRFKRNFKKVTFQLILVIDGWSISCKIVLKWMPMDLTDGKSTLVQVMAWCRQAPSHYLSQCWPRSLSPYVVIRPQWAIDIKRVWLLMWWLLALPSYMHLWYQLCRLNAYMSSTGVSSDILVLKIGRKLMKIERKFKHLYMYTEIKSAPHCHAIWHHRTWSTLVQIMACCPTAPSHYLNQCWQFIIDVLWHSSESNFTGYIKMIYPWFEFENY